MGQKTAWEPAVAAAAAAGRAVVIVEPILQQHGSATTAVTTSGDQSVLTYEEPFDFGDLRRAFTRRGFIERERIAPLVEAAGSAGDIALRQTHDAPRRPGSGIPACTDRRLLGARARRRARAARRLGAQRHRRRRL